MKKKILLIVFFVTLFGFIGWLGVKGISKFSSKNEIASRQENLNTFLEPFNLDLDAHRSTIVVYFNSECDHCHWQIGEMSRNRTALRDYQLYFFSHDEPQHAREFLRENDLEEYYVQAPGEIAMNMFDGGVLQLLIYKNGLLEKHFRGEVKMEAILDVIKQ